MAQISASANRVLLLFPSLKWFSVHPSLGNHCSSTRGFQKGMGNNEIA